MGHARVGNARDTVGMDISPLDIPLRQFQAASISHILDVDPLIGGCRESVVDPEETADPHLFSRREHSLIPLRVDKDYFAGTELFFRCIAQIEIRKAFKAYTVSRLFFADHAGCSAPFIAGSIDSLGRHDQEGHRSLYHVLRVFDSFYNILFLIDQGRHHLCGIYISSAHLKEMRVSPSEEHICEFPDIVNLADCSNGISSVMGTYDQWLRLKITDTSDSEISLHLCQVFLELRSEI